MTLDELKAAETAANRAYALHLFNDWRRGMAAVAGLNASICYVVSHRGCLISFGAHLYCDRRYVNDNRRTP